MQYMVILDDFIWPLLVLFIFISLRPYIIAAFSEYANLLGGPEGKFGNTKFREKLAAIEDSFIPFSSPYPETSEHESEKRFKPYYELAFNSPHAAATSAWREAETECFSLAKKHGYTGIENAKLVHDWLVSSSLIKLSMKRHLDLLYFLQSQATMMEEYNLPLNSDNASAYITNVALAWECINTINSRGY